MELNQISINNEEGRYLLAALAVLNTSPQVYFLNEIKDGREMQMTEILEEIRKLSLQLYPTKNCCS